MPVERRDAVREPAQARAERGVRAADAVVGDVTVAVPLDRRMLTVACEACAYLATFVMASATT